MNRFRLNLLSAGLVVIGIVFPCGAVSAADAPADSVYMRVEDAGSIIGWSSYRSAGTPDGDVKYSGSGVLDSTNRFYWEMILSPELDRVYSVRSNGQFEQGKMSFEATYAPDKAPEVTFTMNEMKIPFKQKKLPASTPVIPGFLPGAFAPFSETLRDKDPETYTLDTVIHNGFIDWKLSIEGLGYQEIRLNEETIKARTFQLDLSQSTLKQQQTISLLQRGDGRFLGIESETGRALVLRGQKAETGPAATADKLAIPTTAGDLDAVLTLPLEAETIAPFPMVLMVSGPAHAGPDGRCNGVPFYKSLATALAEQGIGSLRYARRSDPASGGLQMSDLAADAVAAVEVLREVPLVDPTRIGLLAHGEAAMLLGEIAASAARPESEMRFLVMLGGVTSDGRTLHDAVPRPEDAPWLASFLSYDPRPRMQAVTAPILILHGALDTEVPPQQATDLQTYINAEGRARVFCTVAKNMNHLLQKATTGEIGEYESLGPGCDPAIPTRIAGFVKFCVR